VLKGGGVKNDLRAQVRKDFFQQPGITHATQNILAGNSGVFRLHMPLDFEEAVFR
jgi:hypothetical protein